MNFSRVHLFDQMHMFWLELHLINCNCVLTGVSSIIRMNHYDTCTDVCNPKYHVFYFLLMKVSTYNAYIGFQILFLKLLRISLVNRRLYSFLLHDAVDYYLMRNCCYMVCSGYLKTRILSVLYISFFARAQTHIREFSTDGCIFGDTTSVNNKKLDYHEKLSHDQRQLN